MIIADRYEVLGVIAEGGQALIARARDRHTGQLVAVKMLTSATAQNSEFVQRLAREQEAMLALAGTSAVAVLDLCRAPGGAPCLVMELLEGSDLEQHLSELEARAERLEMERMFEIFDAIVETLERAHEAGILHRDLKPANIYLLSSGGVRLLDFGLSRRKSATPLTVMGTVLGSPSYIAPEVWRGRTDVLDRRVDVYSLSVILYRVLAGKLPFRGETLHEKFIQTTSAERPKLSALRPDLPREIDAWVQAALAIDPDERFSTARAAWNAFLQALRYVPPAKGRPRVQESIVSAWRAAAGAFRRALGGLPTPAPPRPQPSSAPPTPAANHVSSRPPRTAPPPPPRREQRKRLELNAEWLLDSDVLKADEGVNPEALMQAGTDDDTNAHVRPNRAYGVRRRAKASACTHDVSESKRSAARQKRRRRRRLLGR